MATFPTLATGARTCFPWVRRRLYSTSLGAAPTGWQYSWAWIGAGLTGFPTDALKQWQLTFSPITAAELSTLETFFAARNGRYDTFDFVDPEDGTTYTKCRFGQDSLEVEYVAPGHNSLTILIEEFG